MTPGFSKSSDGLSASWYDSSELNIGIGGTKQATLPSEPFCNPSETLISINIIVDQKASITQYLSMSKGTLFSQAQGPVRRQNLEFLFCTSWPGWQFEPACCFRGWHFHSNQLISFERVPGLETGPVPN